MAAMLAGLCIGIVPATGSAAESHPKLVEIEGEKNIPPHEGQEFKDPCGVAADENGYVYVADYYRNRVVIFKSGEPEGHLAFNFVGEISHVDPLDQAGVLPIDGPCDLAVDSAHNLYVNDYHRDVIRLTPAAYPPTGPITYSSEVIDGTESTGVAVDPVSNEVYVDERDRVAVYPPSPFAGTTPIRSIDLGPGADAYGVAVAGAPERVYVADASSDAVRVFDTTGSTVEVIDGTGGPRAGFTSLVDTDLAVDQSDGHLFVVDNLQPHVELPVDEGTGGPEAVVYEFSAAGHYRGRIPSSEGQPSFLDHAEPSGLAIGPKREIFVTSGNRSERAFRPMRAVVYAFATGPPLATHLLSVAKAGAGSGTVSSSPAGLTCGTACVGELDAGSLVTLTATPERGSRFVRWVGCSSGATEGGCSMTMSADRAVTAEFEPFPQRQLSVAKLGSGFGEVRSAPAGIECGFVCEASFDEGGQVTLIATASPPNRFAGWGGCDSEPEPGLCRVTMTAARSVTTSFELVSAGESEEVVSPRSRPPIPALPALPEVASPGLRVGKAIDRGAVAYLPITVPGPGEVSATGGKLTASHALALRRGDLQLALRLNPRGRRHLQRSRGGELAVSVSVTFSPLAEGSSLRAGKKVIFGRAGKKP